MYDNYDSEAVDTDALTPTGYLGYHEQESESDSQKSYSSLFDFDRAEQQPEDMQEQEKEQEYEGELITAPIAPSTQSDAEALLASNEVRKLTPSTAVKRKAEDIEGIDLVNDNNNNTHNNPVHHGHANGLIAAATQLQHEYDQTRSPSSSSPAHQLSSPTKADQDEVETVPTSPAQTVEFEPSQTPIPVPQPQSKPNMSNAPPSLKAIKKPPPRKTKAQPSSRKTVPQNTTSNLEPEQHPEQHPPTTTLPAPSDPRSPEPPPSNSALSDTDPRRLWCICSKPDTGTKMIACDFPSCEISWFHVKCMGLTKSPPKKNDWYCPAHRGGGSDVPRVVSRGSGRPEKRRKVGDVRGEEEEEELRERVKRGGRDRGLRSGMRKVEAAKKQSRVQMAKKQPRVQVAKKVPRSGRK